MRFQSFPGFKSFKSNKSKNRKSFQSNKDWHYKSTELSQNTEDTPSDTATTDNNNTAKPGDNTDLLTESSEIESVETDSTSTTTSTKTKKNGKRSSDPESDPTTDPESDPTTDPEPVSLYDYTSGNEGGFNIDLDFTGDGWSTELKEQAHAMADLLSTLIIGDTPDTKVKGQSIDDLYLKLDIQSMDGSGGRLGAAWVENWGRDSNLPAVGGIRLDTDDADRLHDQGRFDDVVLHEMIHTLGFISSNDSFDSLVGDNNQYLGENGLAAYQAGIDNGTYQQENDLLVNWDTGLHWDKNSQALPANEIMTPTIYTTNQLSTVTLAVLEDLGYQTLWGEGQLMNTPVLLDEITANWAATSEWG